MRKTGSTLVLCLGTSYRREMFFKLIIALQGTAMFYSLALRKNAANSDLVQLYKDILNLFVFCKIATFYYPQSKAFLEASIQLPASPVMTERPFSDVL